MSNRGDFKTARSGAGFLALVWLMGLAIFVGPFVLLNNGSGAVYGAVLGIGWTVGAVLFWIKVGSPAAREELRWQSLEKARKDRRA